jgi:LysR family transcriptional activator of nhaA
VPKLAAFRILEPVLRMGGEVRLVCYEDKPERLLDQLAAHELDVVLADAPIGPSHPSRAYNHLLGEFRIAIFGTEARARVARRKFPQSLAEMPFLLPTPGTTLRRSLDSWFDELGIVPTVVGEFQDSALIVAFGELGAGMFAAPEAIMEEALKARGLRKVGTVGTIEGMRERYYAISIERRLKHPAVLAIAGAAREQLFAARAEGRGKAKRSPI